MVPSVITALASTSANAVEFKENQVGKTSQKATKNQAGRRQINGKKFCSQYRPAINKSRWR